MTYCTKTHPILLSLLTDSYKYGHFEQYPDGVTKMVAYGEFRSAYNKDKDDQRIVFYGMRYVIYNFIAVPWTRTDVDRLVDFLSTHSVFGVYDCPKELFYDFIDNNDGYFPVRIEALPEGSVIYPHVPVYQIIAEGKYAKLVTFFETLLTHVWYPSTVATQSRKCKQVIIESYTKANVTAQDREMLLLSRLHDFGFRGATCTEQSIIGGTAHLLNFVGSDTTSAAYYAQYELNNGKPVAASIPATEHSVMTSFGKSKEQIVSGQQTVSGQKNELAAIQNMININLRNKDKFALFACVADTYDYWNTIFKLFPLLEFRDADGGINKNFTMVWRPDSGDTTLAVLDALIAIEIIKIFGSGHRGVSESPTSSSDLIVSRSLPAEGVNYYSDPIHTVNQGVKYLRFTNFAVIQGDGVDLKAIEIILAAMMDPGRRAGRIDELYAGRTDLKVSKPTYPVGHLISKEVRDKLLGQTVAYSPVNVAFGMGGGLLQKVNRDTMSFATKLCYEEINGLPRNIMKDPISDPDKRSLAGELAVKLVDEQGRSPPKPATDGSLFRGYPLVVPKGKVAEGLDINLLQSVYDGLNPKARIPGKAFADDFDTIRKRVEDQWSRMDKKFDAVSDNMKRLQADTAACLNS